MAVSPVSMGSAVVHVVYPEASSGAPSQWVAVLTQELEH